MSWLGHFWTIAPHLGRKLTPLLAVAADDWSCTVPDERYGTIPLYGQFSDAPNASELVIVVHGLGGSSESGYALGAARAASRAGLACLRLNQRGADGRGEDFYHAGLWQDLDVVLKDPWLNRFSSVYLLGYSIGGQLCLHWGAKGYAASTRVRAIAAVCAPLDLASTAEKLDSAANSVYRAHVMRGLRRTYSAVAARRPVPISVEQAYRVRYIREWDELITAPRFGFSDAQHYYSVASAGPHLRNVACPTLLVIAEQDPMVPLSTVEPALSNVSANVVIERVVRGGHVGFPADLSLQQPGPRGLEPQLLTWLRRNGGSRPGGSKSLGSRPQRSI